MLPVGVVYLIITYFVDNVDNFPLISLNINDNKTVTKIIYKKNSVAGNEKSNENHAYIM